MQTAITCNPLTHYYGPMTIYTSPTLSPSTTAHETPCQGFIRDIQRISHYDLKDIARATGIPLSSLYQLLNGTTEAPQHKAFSRILKLYCQLLVKNGLV